MENQAQNGFLRGISWGAATDKGKIREHNEDAFHIEPEIGLFMVSDGIGGHLGGELASGIVTEDLPVLIETRLHRMKSSHAQSIRRMLKKSIEEQSRQIRLEGQSGTGYKEMGATVILTLIRDNRAFMANLGDSRLYRLRKERLKQLSRDHSLLVELLESGHVSPEEASDHPAKVYITRYMGMESQALSQVRSFKLHPNDRLLLCTDGLTDMLTDSEIRRILLVCPEPQSACDKLVSTANAAGGHDNITAVIIDFNQKKTNNSEKNA